MPARRIGASFGDAFLAGQSTGISPDSAELSGTWVTIDRVVWPDPSLSRIYDERYGIFTGHYQSTAELVHRFNPP